MSAPAAGVVTLAQTLAFAGQAVVIDHGRGVVSAFFHLSKIAVSVGDRVEPRTVLGASGDSGVAVTVPAGVEPALEVGDADELLVDGSFNLIAIDGEIAERRAQAEADIAAARQRALAELQLQVTELAIGAAESVVEANLDRDTNARIVENFIQRVGAGT